MTAGLQRGASSKPPRKSWPLLTLAALSFIPGFGLFFAAAALSWALVSNRPKARLAGILATTGAVLQIGLGGLMYFWLDKRPEMAEARRITAQQDMVKVVNALEDYHAEHNAYPHDLVTLVGYPIPTRFLNISDQSAGHLGLGEQYLYVLSGDGLTYDLYARGSDGKAGTADDIRPRLTDSLATHSGYRPAR